jgi:molybdenum cofactor cytidylyltransferase
MPNSVAAILLAAGASRRMGTCKQLLLLEGKTVLARCLETLLHGGIKEVVVVVVAPTGDEVRRVAAGYPVRVVRNAEPDGDMAASICTGRDALSPTVSGVVIALCDYPLVRAETIARLTEAHRQAPDAIIVPCHDGHRGHPPLLPRRLLDALQKPLTLRDLLRDQKELVHHLELPDDGVLIDMDTPEDYHRIAAMHRPQS